MGFLSNLLLNLSKEIGGLNYLLDGLKFHRREIDGEIKYFLYYKGEPQVTIMCYLSNVYSEDHEFEIYLACFCFHKLILPNLNNDVFKKGLDLLNKQLSIKSNRPLYIVWDFDEKFVNKISLIGRYIPTSLNDQESRELFQELLRDIARETSDKISEFVKRDYWENLLNSQTEKKDDEKPLFEDRWEDWVV